MADEFEDEWSCRARRLARINPRARVGAVANGGLQSVPCLVTGRGGVERFSFAVADVPAEGDCLYHAVWQGAKLQGLDRPFGLAGIDHVYSLRVQVAARAVQLLSSGILFSGTTDTPETVGEFIARPRQYQKYSGQVPLMAMAHLLRRTIVTLSSDGILSVSPHDFEEFFGESEKHCPVVIYHCQAGRISHPATFYQRNHYAAATFDRLNEARLCQVVERYRYGQGTGGDDLNTPNGAVLIDDRDAPYATVSVDEKCEASLVRVDPLRGTSSSRRARNDTSPVSLDRCNKKARRDDDSLLASLSKRATTLSNVTDDELRALASGQNFAWCPRLALLYFHCCSNDPRAFVFNNEKLTGPKSKETIDRMVGALESPATPEQVQHCQQLAARESSASTDLLACASCCEILQGGAITLPLSTLPTEFQLTGKELSALSSTPDRVVRSHVQVIVEGGVYYHLNPDLVPDTSAVVLCHPCSVNPRKVTYSIACGHDYGRVGDLPVLNDVASNCIAPVRCFGLELCLSGKHTTGHAICFPSDGIKKCATVLPVVDLDSTPRVTFVGPSEQWRAKKGVYRRLYALRADDVYAWLRVLRYTHGTFRGIAIEDTPLRRSEIQELQQYIEEHIVFEESAEVGQASDRVHSERFREDVTESEGEELVVTRAAVLKNPEDGVALSSSNSIVETVLSLINAEGSPSVQPSMETEHSAPGKTAPPVVPIQREAEPVAEWTRNGCLIAGAFPQLFMMGGEALPQGSWGADFVKHLMNYYDGRFERNTMLVAYLFNQLQRHTAVKRAAAVGTTHPVVLERFGSLVNSPEFHKRLMAAKDHPDSRSAKQLSASLLRVLAVVGGCVPFSPFERAATRPKIAALRYRYGVPQHWVTLAPPEHDDLILQRTAQIRKQGCWNRGDYLVCSRSCQFEDLPGGLAASARTRLAVANEYPALAMQAFERRFRSMFRDVMLCSTSGDIRVSRHFGERLVGAYGKVAAHCSVVEAQVDGRLHSHSLVYGSSYTPQILTRIACSGVLCSRAAKWLDSVSCTKLRPEVHQWRVSFQAVGSKMPRAFEIALPSAGSDLDQFRLAAEKRVATTNIHTHSSTCLKGVRGKYMCRLARPAGVHNASTQPILVLRDRVGDFKKGVRAKLNARGLDAAICSIVDGGYDIDAGKLFRHELEGPIVWELHRPHEDASVVETNLVLASLTASHTNSVVVGGEDAGDMIEQYQQAYMTKDDPGLKTAIPVVMSAIDYIVAHPSQADDRDTEIRKGKYLAARTVNAFSGAHEWSHSVMVFALMGHRSFTSSDTFWYIFPHALVKWMTKKARQVKARVEGSSGSVDVDAGDGEVKITTGGDYVDGELERLVAMANNDSHCTVSRATGQKHGGTRSYRVEGRVVFVSQVESYINRGAHFVDYSPLEFESIVDVLPTKASAPSTRSRGRPSRPGFPFAATHPLYGHYSGFIRMKMHTPVFGGRPPPTWKQDTDKRSLARYVLCVFTAWGDQGVNYQFDQDGLVAVCKEWDNSEAPLINRQRYRYLRNVLKRGHRSSKNESIISDWRNRGVDFWKEGWLNSVRSKTTGEDCRSADPEKDGLLPTSDDVCELVERVMAGDSRKRGQLRAMEAALLAVIEEGDQNAAVNDGSISRCLRDSGIFLRGRAGGTGTLKDIASRIHGLVRCEEETEGTKGGRDVRDKLTGAEGSTIDVSGLSPCQACVVNRVVGSYGDDGRRLQTLTMLHGAGGTGKSFVVRRICSEIERRGLKVVSTCPTGAGACQLTNGQTFHSAFKCMRGHGVSAQALELLRQTFDADVALIVVDEASMFSAELLVVLDERLRTLYSSTKVFGGVSVLLVGDFSQLAVVSGMSLCKLMYASLAKPALVTGRLLFKQFQVVFLTQQHRASGCETQQRRLDLLRSLPATYPTGVRWSKTDSHNFKPLCDDVVRALTTPLTVEDVLSDSNWVDSSVIIVTSNIDRAVMNSCMARVLAQRSKVLLYRWKKPISDDLRGKLGARACELLYNESDRPMLFGYFFQGASAQLLDNANGNVMWGMANGTLCKYHSLAWEDDAKTNTVLDLVGAALQTGKNIVDLPFAPDYINVTLLDRNKNPVGGAAWPPDLNLSSVAMSSEDSGDTTSTVVVPIGYVASKGEAFFVTIQDRDTNDGMNIYYKQHAVDLAMAMTIWKAQGSTFDKVILLLEVSHRSPSWQFEHVYVALSRVRAAEHLRCIPLSYSYDRSKLRKLRPNIFTVKWRMDIDSDGYWQPSVRSPIVSA